MKLRIINFDGKIGNTIHRWSFHDMLKTTIINLLESFNGAQIQPLLIYNRSIKNLNNISRKRSVNKIENLDFDKINENIIILDSMYYFLYKEEFNNSRYSKYALNEELLINFLNKCKEYDIDLILKIDSLIDDNSYNEILYIIDDLNIEKDIFTIYDKSSFNSLYNELRRYITMKYLMNTI